MANLGNLFSLLDGQEDEGTSKILDNVAASTAASRKAAADAKAKKAAELLEKKKAAEVLEKRPRNFEQRRRRYNQFRSERSEQETLKQQGEGQAVYNNNGYRAADVRPATGDSKRSEQGNAAAVVVNDDGDKRFNGNGYQNGNNQYRPYNGNYNRNGRYNNGGVRRNNAGGKVVEKAAPKVDKDGFQLVVSRRTSEPKNVQKERNNAGNRNGRGYYNRSSNNSSNGSIRGAEQQTEQLQSNAAADVASVKSEAATTAAADVVSVKSDAATADSKSEVAQGDSANAEQPFVKRPNWNMKKPKKTNPKKAGVVDMNYSDNKKEKEQVSEAAVKELTLEEYEKIRAEKKAALESLKNGGEKRDVTLDKDLQSMVLVQKKKDEQAEKNVTNKKESDEQSEKKTVKKMSIDEFLADEKAKKGSGRRRMDDRRSGESVLNGKGEFVVEYDHFPKLGGGGGGTGPSPGTSRRQG